ncbi:MAG: hypothetical protein QE274_03230 [Verrucomicrobiaceae bacterium]|jgi:hypothetical protein|nr:hypothetical protein [Verrucomicrobiaceae bacterium]
MRQPTPRNHHLWFGITASALVALSSWLGWRVSDPTSDHELPELTVVKKAGLLMDVSHASIKEEASLPLSPSALEEIERIRRELAIMQPILPGEIENDIAMDLLRRWARLDPAGAIQFAAAHRDLHGSDSFASELFIGWMDARPEAAMAWVKTMRDAELRFQLLPAVISRMVQEHPGDALRLTLELRGENRDRAISALFAEWAENDIQAAAAAANAMNSPADRASAQQHVATQWAEHDPAAAMKWISAAMTYDVASDVDFENTALGLVLEKWAAKSPQEAAQFALASERGFGRNHMLTTVAAQWAGQDPAAALQWSSKLRDAEDRDAIATSVIASIGEANVSSAANLALTLPSGSTRDQSLGLLLDRWTSSNPAEVSIWATQQLKSGGTQALNSIVKAWADSDVQALGTWLNSLPPSRPRDEGFATLARHLGPTHPDLAALWVDAIADGGLRDLTARTLGTAR